MYVSKHQRTLLSVAAVESCVVMMIQRKDTLPPNYDTRVVRLSHTMWTQLRNNTWIYFAPHLETLTIVCPNGKPLDVTVRGTGKLCLYPGCRGYSTATILYGSALIINFSTYVQGDLVPNFSPVYLLRGGRCTG